MSSLKITSARAWSLKYFADQLFAVFSLIDTSTLPQLETRLHRVERQNRIILVLLFVAAGLAFLGATRSGGHVIIADEVRAQRLSLINDKGNVVREWVVHGGWLVEH